MKSYLGPESTASVTGIDDNLLCLISKVISVDQKVVCVRYRHHLAALYITYPIKSHTLMGSRNLICHAEVTLVASIGGVLYLISKLKSAAP